MPELDPGTQTKQAKLQFSQKLSKISEDPEVYNPHECTGR